MKTPTNMKKGILLGLLLLQFYSTLFGQIPTLVKSFKEVQYGNNSVIRGLKELESLENRVLFSADNGINGRELWISDGTDKGTFILKNIAKDSLFISSSSPSKFKRYGNLVIFEAAEGSPSFPEIFRTDGTEKGTFKIGSIIEKIGVDILADSLTYWLYSDKLILKDFNSMGSKIIFNKSLSTEIIQFYIPPMEWLSSSYLTRYNNNWLFNAKTVNSNYGLYISDATQKNTQKLLTSNVPIPVTKSKIANGLFVFFIYDDGINGRELWKTDGTSKGTQIVKDIVKGKLGAIASWDDVLIPVKNGIVFKADDGVNGLALWFSDGTESGTKMLKDFAINENDFGKSSFNIIDSGDEKPLIYHSDSQKLWRTDGTTNGTVFISEGFVNSIVKNKNTIFFTQINPITAGAELKMLNSETNEIKKIYNFGLTAFGAATYTIANQTLYFSKEVNNGPDELWKLDFSVCTHTAKINTPNGTSFCTGGSVNITGEATGTTNPFTYKWKQGTNDLGTATTLTVTKAGTYTLDVTDKGGCTVSASIDITLTANLPVNITGTNNFCAGQSTTLTANVTGGVSPFAFQWKNNTSNVGTNANTLVASTGGTYSVGITDSKGCTGTSANYPVTQNPPPNVTITKSGATDLLTGGSVVLSVPSATNQTYQWSKDGVAISGATNNSYTANGAGKFSVTVIANGCPATSEAVTVNVILANELPSESKNFKVSPNPFENTIKVNFNEPLTKTAKLNLISSNGIVLKEWATNQQENSFDILGLPSGLYILKCEIKDIIEVVKLIKN